MGYRNPVVPGFFPDPSVCRDGDGYVMATSSFTYAPGVPILRSRDLVHWEHVANALDRPSQLDLSATTSNTSLGVWAPTIRVHDGRWWLAVTVMLAGGPETLLVTAADPAGPWSDPVRLAVQGFDPDLAWDDDGALWVHTSIDQRVWRHRVDPTTGGLLEPAVETWSGTGLRFPESPHLYRRDGGWILLIAEGGTERGHAVSVARGPSPQGPWEPHPANPILSHRSTDRPIQNVGHADLVEAPDGSWWMLLLAVRPRGFTPGFHVLGRETFLAPVTWADGWPVVAPLELEVEADPPGGGDSAATGSPTLKRDDFEAQALGPDWIGVRRAPAQWVDLAERPGWLTLRGSDDGLSGPYPAFVGRRARFLASRARCRMDAGDALVAGLAVRMDEAHWAALAVRRGELVVRVRIGPLEQDLAAIPVPADALVLRIETAEPPAWSGPDVLRLGWEDADGAFHVLAEMDGRYLSTEVAGGFTGRVLGVYAVRGSAAFDWFEEADLSG